MVAKVSLDEKLTEVGNSGKDVGDVEVRRGEFRRIKLAGFMELGKGGMDQIEMVWRIRMLGSKVFPAETVTKEVTSALVRVSTFYSYFSILKK